MEGRRPDRRLWRKETAGRGRGNKPLDGNMIRDMVHEKEERWCLKVMGCQEPELKHI